MATTRALLSCALLAALANGTIDPLPRLPARPTAARRAPSTGATPAPPRDTAGAKAGGGGGDKSFAQQLVSSLGVISAPLASKAPLDRHAANSQSERSIGAAADAAGAAAEAADAWRGPLSSVSVRELSRKVRDALRAADADFKTDFDPSPRPVLKINLDLINYRARELANAAQTAPAADDAAALRARALALWRRATELDPADGRAWLALARDASKRLGDAADAEALLRRGLSFSPRNAFLLQSLGVLRERAFGDVAGAAAAYREALAARPRHSAAWVALGTLETRAGSLAEGLRCLERAVSVDPSNEVTWHALANWHYRAALAAGSPPPAPQAPPPGRDEPRATRPPPPSAARAPAVARDPAAERAPAASASELDATAAAAAAAADPAAASLALARRYLEKATELAPGNAVCWAGLAAVEARAGALSAADAALRRASRCAPRNTRVLLAQAALQAQLGQPREAAALRARSLRLRPDDGALYTASAMAALGGAPSVGEVAALVVEAQTARARAERDSAAAAAGAAAALAERAAQAALQARRGAVREARETLLSGIERAPRHLPCYQALGLLEIADGGARALAAARRLFQRGIWADPMAREQAAFIWHAWALVEEGAGDAQLARAYLRRGADADPSSTVILQSWAELEARQCNAAAATRLFESALAKAPLSARLADAHARFLLRAERAGHMSGADVQAAVGRARVARQAALEGLGSPAAGAAPTPAAEWAAADGARPRDGVGDGDAPARRVARASRTRSEGGAAGARAGRAVSVAADSLLSELRRNLAEADSDFPAM